MKTAILTGLAGAALLIGSAFVPATSGAAQDNMNSGQGSKGGSSSSKGEFVEQEYDPIVPAEFSKDELAQFFELMSQDPSYTDLIDPEIKALMKPGPIVKDWESTGIDIVAEIEKKRGGVKANLLHEDDPEMPAFYDVTGTIEFDFTGFETHILKPSPDGRLSERVIINFVDGFWFEVQSFGQVRRGNTTCIPNQFGVSLHSAKPYAQWSEDELIDLTFIYTVLKALNEQEFCSAYERKGSNLYLARSFLPNGRSLPDFDDEDEAALFKIVPVRTVERMLREDLEVQARSQ